MSVSQIRRNGAYYDTRPASPMFGGAAGSVDAVRKFGQGAGAAMLMFSGADSVVNGGDAAAAAGASPVMDFASLNGFAESLATGGLNGPMQIIGALVIFVLAGKSIARVIGLMAAAAAIIMYLQGVTVADAGQFVGDFGERLGAASHAFLTADVAG